MIFFVCSVRIKEKRADETEGKVYILLDEIQEVAGWEQAINLFRIDFDCDIFITGSNAKLLSGELFCFAEGCDLTK